MIKVAINGYGRIGRIAHRVILERFTEQIDLVAINGGSSTDIQGWAYLLKYDTAYGILKDHAVSCEQQTENSQEIPKLLGNLIIDSNKIPFYAEKNPEMLPWKKHDVDVVLECTGVFTTADKIAGHLKAGAEKVILSAPAKDSTVRTYVLGVNLDPAATTEQIVSNASCTTNCIAPVAQVISEKFGVEKAMMTTVHSYTSDQELQDGGHKDYRRARAAAQNIVPTTTGATRAAAETVPELAGLFTGLSIRVPTIVGSLSDFTFVLKRDTTKEEVNQVLTEAARSERYRNILEVTTDPLVSSDVIRNPHSAIVDLSLTDVVGGNLLKVIAWYDNEWGYTNRLIEEVILVGQRGSRA